MRRRAILTGVLALALVLAFAGAAMAATVPGTQISNDLSASVTVVSPANSITLQWYAGSVQAGSETVSAVDPTGLQSVRVGDTIPVAVKAIKNISGTIDRVLYVVEVTGSQNGFTVQGYDYTLNQWIPLGYDSQGGFYYWGPRQGFSFTDAMGTPTSPFKITFSQPGTYSFKIYAVQLPL